MADTDLQRVEQLIETLVKGAGIPSRRGRDDLRRELWSHFEECPGGDLAAAVARFGDAGQVTAGLRHAYRRDRLLCNLLELAASAAVSALVALLIQLAANLRPGGGAALWRLAPAFPRSALVSVAVALGVVGAWESLRRPFDRVRGAGALALFVAASLAVQATFGRGIEAFGAAVAIVVLGLGTSRLQIRPGPLLAAYAAFSVLIYAVHRMSLPEALTVAAALLAVWAASLVILSRLDQVFGALIEPT